MKKYETITTISAQILRSRVHRHKDFFSSGHFIGFIIIPRMKDYDDG